MPLYNGDARLAAPTPRHWLTESAELARRAVQRFAWRKRNDRPLVTKLEHPDAEAPVTANARALIAAAQAAGLEAVLTHGRATVNAGKVNEARHPAIQVAGWSIERGIGFRATWVKGKAGLGIWYEVGVTSRAGETVGVSVVLERVKGLSA